MNCVDITLLCVFKKSLSNIYVTFFFEWLERVSASGRTHITLLRHLRNRPKTYTFAVANRNKKTVNHKFVRRKVFIKDFVRHIVNLAVGFVIFICVHNFYPFLISFCIHNLNSSFGTTILVPIFIFGKPFSLTSSYDLVRDIPSTFATCDTDIIIGNSSKLL